MAFDTSGDSSVFVKYSGGTVQVGAGNATQLTVGANNVTVVNDLVSTNGDISANGGYKRDHRFFAWRVKQGGTPVMTSSIFDFSGTAASNNTRQVWTRVPLMSSGSVVGIALLTEDATVKSGSLSASVYINNGAAALCSLGMFTGTVASTTFAKDAFAFVGNSYMTVQLTASSVYLTDTDPNSGSFICLVQVEY